MTLELIQVLLFFCVLLLAGIVICFVVLVIFSVVNYNNGETAIEAVKHALKELE